jgi:hypothetical protein
VRRNIFGRRPQRFVEFLATREELDSKYPLSEQLRPGNKVYGAWLTGKAVFAGHRQALEQGILQKVVLPHPDSPTLKSLSASLTPHDTFFKFADEVVSRLMWKSAERISRLVSNTLLTRPT